MKNISMVLLITMFLFSCTKEDIPEYARGCKILKSGGIQGLTGNQLFHQHEYIYDNNLLVKRVNFDNTITSSAGGIYSHGEISRDSYIICIVHECISYLFIFGRGLYVLHECHECMR